MSIRLFNNSGGYIDLESGGTSAAANVFTLPAETGTILTSATTSGINASALSAGTLAAARLPAGSVLQVVQTVKTNTFSTASTSLTDITGMSVSITPTSASNKILVCFDLGHVDGSASIIGIALLRDSTKIGSGAAAGSRILVSTGSIVNDNRGGPQSFMFLDSPNTTSSTTYKLQMFTHNATAYVNRSTADTDSVQYFRTASTITVMEIAG